MGLLAQLFRHKRTPPSDTTDASPPVAAGTHGAVRGVGAIAAAAGVKADFGMPAEFSLPLADLLARVSPHCVWPGRHEDARTVRIPAAEIAPGLARGKAELSLAQLVALAPDVFRNEGGDAEETPIRLPIQKLLLQIRSGESASENEAMSERIVAPQSAVHEPEFFQGGNSSEKFFLHPGTGGQSGANAVSLERANASMPLSSIAGTTLRPAPHEATPEPPRTLAPEARDLSATAPATPPTPSPTISITPTAPLERRIELRPSADVEISTTLHAIVLGGVTAQAPSGGRNSQPKILAPRPAPASPVPPSVPGSGPSIVATSDRGAAALASRAAPDFAGLQNLFMTATTLDFEVVAALAAALPGVQACMISFGEITVSAGDFSREVSADGLRAAIADLARIGGAAMEMMHCGELDIAIFLHDEICVAAVIAAGGFVPGVRERLARAAELLAGRPPSR